MCFFDEGLGLVVTNLQWLAEIFKEVVSFYSGVRDGVVTLSGLRQNAWRHSSVSEIKQHMALLEKFHMAFPRLDEDSWVVPSMLKEQPVSQQPLWSRTRGIRRYERVYEMDLMPSGAVGRLISRLQGHPGIKVGFFSHVFSRRGNASIRWWTCGDTACIFKHWTVASRAQWCWSKSTLCGCASSAYSALRLQQRLRNNT